MSECRKTKIIKYVCITVLIVSFIIAAILFFFIQKKLKDNKNIKSAENLNEKNEINFETTNKELNKTIKTILNSPFSNTKNINEKIKNGNYVFLKNLKDYHERLDRYYKSENVKSSRQTQTDNTEDYNKHVKKMEFGAKLTEDLIEVINFMIEKDLLNILKLKLNTIINEIIQNIANFKSVDDLYQHIQIPLDELLHIIGSLAFKYKNFLQNLFFYTSFGQYGGFGNMLESLNKFSIWSHETYKDLLDLKSDQMKRLKVQLENIKTRSKTSYSATKIHDKADEFLFEFNKIKNDNYLLKETQGEDIDATKYIYLNIIIQSSVDEKNDSKNFTMEEFKFNDDDNADLENKFPAEKFYFPSIIANYFNNFKYKIFNSKVILYCYEKFNTSENLIKFLNLDKLSENDRKVRISKFLDHFIKFNDQKFIFLLIRRFYIFLFHCQEMQEYTQKQITSSIKLALKDLLEISKKDFEMFAYLLKTFNEKKKN